MRAKTTAAAEIVSLALAGLRPEKVSKASGIKLTVNGKPGEWTLRDHSNHIRRKFAHGGDLIYHLTDRLVFYIADKAEEKHCLHAAAVSHQGASLLIPANSGAGKSSLTTWLVAQGFDYITDELILIDQELRIDGLGRPIQIKANGIEAISALVDDVRNIQTGKIANAIPISSLKGDFAGAESYSPGLFIFPQYRKSSEYVFEQLSSAEAGMKLMANHVNARNLEGHGFRTMMKMIRSTPAYRLEYGGFAKLPDDFVDQLKSIMVAQS